MSSKVAMLSRDVDISVIVVLSCVLNVLSAVRLLEKEACAFLRLAVALLIPEARVLIWEPVSLSVLLRLLLPFISMSSVLL